MSEALVPPGRHGFAQESRRSPGFLEFFLGTPAMVGLFRFEIAKRHLFAYHKSLARNFTPAEDCRNIIVGRLHRKPALEIGKRSAAGNYHRLESG